MELDEMKETVRAKHAEIVEEEEFQDEGEDLLITQDVVDAIALLRRCMHLLDYMGNVDLCKTVTKREREVMLRVSESITTFLEDVEPHYDKEEE